VVVDEGAKDVHISEGDFFFGVSCSNLVHRLAVAEHIVESVEHGVVEQRSHVILVVSNVVDISIEDFTDLENSSSGVVLGPEIFGDMGNGVDANAIEIKLFNCALDPFEEVVANELVALVEVGETGEPAVFNLPLVVPIVDIAFCVVVLRLVKRVNIRKVTVCIVRAVVGHNIKHNPDIFCVGCGNQRVQLLLASEVFIYTLPI